MILTIADYRKYLPSNTVTDATRFASFEHRALLKYFPRYLGKELTRILDSEPENPAAQALLEHVIPPLVNLTYLESIPFFNLVLTSTGFGVVSNQNVAPASVERIRDLKNACLEAANEGINQLLLHLEETRPELWNQSSLYPNSLIPDTDAFNEATGLFIPRVHFVEVKPHLHLAKVSGIFPLFSKEFYAWLLTSEDTLIKPLVSKGLAFGAYDLMNRTPAFDAKGKPLPVNEMWKMVSKRYMDEALSLLSKNLDLYPVYRDHGYEGPIDNAQRGEESSFFIGGLTA